MIEASPSSGFRLATVYVGARGLYRDNFRFDGLHRSRVENAFFVDVQEIGQQPTNGAAINAENRSARTHAHTHTHIAQTPIGRHKRQRERHRQRKSASSMD